jgi:LPPG:FO 2-phospho-L-lactate transferase
VGISPIVGGAPLKGPADKLMQAFNIEVSAYGVARYYAAFLKTLIIDTIDAELQPQIEELDINVAVTDTVMKNLEDKIALAKITLEELDKLLK